MPTPSSHDDNDSRSFNSTCPDEQVPRAPSGWLHPPPTYEDSEQQPSQSSQRNEVVVVSSGGGSAGDIGESQSSPADDAPDSAHSSPALSPSAEPSSTTISPMPLTESIFSRDSEHDAEPQEDDDDANKHTDTDEDMADNTNHPGASADEQDAATSAETILSRASRSRSNSTRRPSGREVARFEIPDTDLWEPYGVNQTPRRRFDIATIGPAHSRTAANAITDAPLPLSNADDSKIEETQDADDDLAWIADPALYTSCDPTGVRLIPTAPSTFLRPGSRFVGTQQSERQVYDVQVEIKHVDLRESFLCGYLRIQGLTEDNPTLTTYFEGEIIGSKYGFTTKHKVWGANDRIDMSHWAKFAAFRQFAKQAKKGNFVIKEHLQKENIFMRWKEHFLVPDHRVKIILGASFEGFYYICFNQVEGVVHGIYFHSKSEKFQQLELKHVEDKGCMSALEFR